MAAVLLAYLPSLVKVFAYVLVALFTLAMVLGFPAVSRWFRRSAVETAEPSETGRQRSRKPPRDDVEMDHTDFFGSQLGGQSVINYSYTDMPWKLMMWDIRNFITYSWALPWIVWPIRPRESESFDELEFTAGNVWCMFVHAVLIVVQLAFILVLPLAFLLPVWLFIGAMAVFFAINSFLCLCLNGSTIIYESDPKYAPALEEHRHEQWVFLNGVAVGEAWLKNNINRLALTFKRPVIGVHNRTTGIIFDVMECLIQRNFGYATRDIRLAYKIVKEKLYNPQYSKVVFILHSQGAIEGGLVLDWLIQELPQDLLAKLEVYTFGSAANHFNNPHRHMESQEAEKIFSRTGTTVGLPTDVADVPITDSPVEMKTPMNKSSFKTTNGDHPQPLSSLPSASNSGSIAPPTQTYTMPASDRVISHVEHYAHTTDFVALWGVLHFVTSERATPDIPRFIGRVFRRASSRGGHQFCQHYLDGMFPLARDADTGELVGCRDSNDFMDSVVELGGNNSSSSSKGQGTEREELGGNWAVTAKTMIGRDEARDDATINSQTIVHGSFHQGDGAEDFEEGKVRVRDLSRLWLYRNGKSPPEVPRTLLVRGGDGVVRGATL